MIPAYSHRDGYVEGRIGVAGTAEDRGSRGIRDIYPVVISLDGPVPSASGQIGIRGKSGGHGRDGSFSRGSDRRQNVSLAGAIIYGRGRSANGIIIIPGVKAS
jgi:hypothetical protein